MKKINRIREAFILISISIFIFSSSNILAEGNKNNNQKYLDIVGFVFYIESYANAAELMYLNPENAKSKITISKELLKSLDQYRLQDTSTLGQKLQKQIHQCRATLENFIKSRETDLNNNSVYSKKSDTIREKKLVPCMQSLAPLINKYRKKNNLK